MKKITLIVLILLGIATASFAADDLKSMLQKNEQVLDAVYNEFTTIIEVAKDPAVVRRAQFVQISIGLALVSHDYMIFLLDSEKCFSKDQRTAILEYSRNILNNARIGVWNNLKGIQRKTIRQRAVDAHSTIQDSLLKIKADLDRKI